MNENNRYRKYYAGFSVRLGILRSAAVIFSAISFFTTFQGFRDTVFGSSFLAAGASLGVQSILLAGVFFYCPIVNIMLNVVPGREGVEVFVDDRVKDPNAHSKKTPRPLKVGFLGLIKAYWYNALLLAAIVFGGVRLWSVLRLNEAQLTLKVLGFAGIFALGTVVFIVLLGLKPSFRVRMRQYLVVWGITVIILIAMSVSTMFSCVAITNMLYKTDYARDSDPVIEETVRTELLNLDKTIGEMLQSGVPDDLKTNDENMRQFLIKKITDTFGEIDKSATQKAKTYFAALPDLTIMPKAEMLYSYPTGYEKDNDLKEKTLNGNRMEGETPVQYTVQKKKLKQAEPIQTGTDSQGDNDNNTKPIYYYVQNNYAWASQIFNVKKMSWYPEADALINELNSTWYSYYVDYYNSYKNLLTKYSQIVSEVINDGEKKEDVKNDDKETTLSLIKIKAIRAALNTLKDSIALDSQIARWNAQKQLKTDRTLVGIEEDQGEYSTFLIRLDSLQKSKNPTPDELELNPDLKHTLENKKGSIIDEAIQTSLTLRDKTQEAIDEIDNLLKAAYGSADVLTVDQIVEIVGLSEPTNQKRHDDDYKKNAYSDIDILEKAAKQLRNAQGSALSHEYNDDDDNDNDDDNNNDDDINTVSFETITDIFNSYVQLMKTKADLAVLSDSLNTSYVIIEEESEEESDEDTEKKDEEDSPDGSQSSEPPVEKAEEQQSTTNTPNDGSQSKDASGLNVEPTVEENPADGSQASDTSEPASENENTTNTSDDNQYTHNVEKVTVDALIEIRKKQLSRLKAAATAVEFAKNSLNLSDNVTNSSTNTVQGVGSNQVGEPKQNTISEQDAISEIDKLTHIYLNATDLEKTYNLLINSKENEILKNSGAQSKAYFTYRGKAILALGISMFMDLGSALIGVLMFFLDPKEMEKKLIGFWLWMKAGSTE